MTLGLDNLSEKDRNRLNEILAESARRSMEGLKLFRPLQHQMPFFESRASEFLLRGGNRSGKTVCVSAEVSSAFTAQPIIGPDGEPMPMKYPTNRPLLIWVIGYGEQHIGDTLYRMLFRRNPEFKMIRDLESGEWRTYRPWEIEDKEREAEARMAPPMIPKRCIDPKGWAWKDKAKRHFTICRGVNESEIHAFTSKGEPKMGDPVDLIWIDERIMFSKHYPEWQARISDRQGRIIWSSWPGYGNAALIDLIRRAKIEEGRTSPDVQELRLRFSANPYIPQQEKVKRLKGWSEEERKSRDEGELVEGAKRVYPSFSETVHGTPCDDEQMDDRADRVLRKQLGTPPLDWRRDLILDPGHAHPGVLFCALPPPTIARCGVVYDELYLPNTDAEILAEECARKMRGFSFETFIIDSHAAQQTPMGFNKSVLQQYSEAFEKFGLKSRQTDSNFCWASDDVASGLGLVRSCLLIGANGRPWLRVVRDQCPTFCQQMEWYTKAQDANGFVIDKPAPRQVDPLCDCIRYWVCSDPRYIVPDEPRLPPGPTVMYFRNEWKDSPKEPESMMVGAGSIP